MAFDWTEEDVVEAARIPLGIDIDVTITKVVFGTKKKGPFQAQDGSAKIMLVMADAEGREAAQMVTLSEKAGFKLRSILSAANVDRAKMKADGVEIGDFADEKFATANLVGRKLKIRVTEYAKENGNSAEVTPIRSRPKPNVDDIPM